MSLIRIWNDELIEVLRQLWWDGERADVIGCMMGKSKKSILKVVEKHNLVRNPNHPSFRRIKAPTAKPPTPVVPRNVEGEPPPRLKADGSVITIGNVGSRECRWMNGRGATAQLCGHRTHQHRSWCDYHATKRVFVPRVVYF